MYGWISLAVLAQFEIRIRDTSRFHVFAAVNKFAFPQMVNPGRDRQRYLIVHAEEGSLQLPAIPRKMRLETDKAGVGRLSKSSIQELRELQFIPRNSLLPFIFGW
jgi:hypothetical protein